MKNILLLLSFVLSVSCFGQERDPFLEEQGFYGKTRWTIKDSSTVSRFVKEINSIAYMETKRAEVIARHAIAISDKIEFIEGKIDAALAMASVKVYDNDYDSAMYYVEKAERVSIQRKLKKKELRCMEMKASVLCYKQQYDKAIDVYFETIKEGTKIGERQTLKSYTNLGYAFKQLNNLQRARQYSDKAYALGKQYNDTASMVSSLNILGLTDKAENKFDDALKHFEEGLDLARKKGIRERESQLLYNISNVYFAMEDYDLGFKYFNESIEISKYNGSYRSTAISFHSLSIHYYESGRIAESLRIADSAMLYAELSKNFEIIVQAYGLKAELYYETGRYRDAFDYLVTAYDYKDSLNLSQLNDAALSAENAFDREKQRIQDSLFRVQKKIEFDTQEKINQERLQSRDLLIWIFAGVLVLALIGGYFLIKNNRLIKTQNALVNSQKEEIQVQHGEIRDSINYAKRIQDAMILKQSEWEKISPNHWIFFRPKDVVSGDFYWVHSREDLAIWAVADCTGHGVPGAFMSMLGYGFLNEIIIEGGCTDPSEILNRLRSKIIGALSEKGENSAHDGMDISLCVWNKKENTLTYAGALNPLWLIRHKSSELPEKVKRTTTLADSALQLLEIEPDKMPVGFTGAAPNSFTNKTIPLYSGDVIVLHTDGFADQFGGPDGKKLKYAPLKRTLLEMQGVPFEEHEKILAKTFDDWRGGLDQVDDVCLVGVKVV